MPHARVDISQKAKDLVDTLRKTHGNELIFHPEWRLLRWLCTYVLSTRRVCALGATMSAYALFTAANSTWIRISLNIGKIPI